MSNLATAVIIGLMAFALAQTLYTVDALYQGRDDLNEGDDDDE